MSSHRSRTESDYRERILRVLVHVQQNLDAALSLDELAAVACFSPFHFHRVFRGLVGESVQQHVRRLRLERAALQLRHTDRPVTTIAFEAGYEAHESFTRAFSRSFGCPPSEFRASATLATQLDAPSGVHMIAAGAQQLSFIPVKAQEPDMNVDIKIIEPVRIAFVRHVGPYDEVGGAWERLLDWVGIECLFGSDVRLFGMGWDDPEATPPDKIRYDACVSIDDTATPADGISVSTVAGGRYAATLHEGPYNRLNDTYSALVGRWFPRQGLEPGEPPALEFYLNDPDSTDPEDLLTEVCFPIAAGE